MNYNMEQLKSAVAQIVVRAGLPLPQSELLADLLVVTEAKGVYSHGIGLLKRYVDEILKGYVNPHPRGFLRLLGLIVPLQNCPNLAVDLLGDLGILPNELAGIVLALADAHVTVGEPGARLVDDIIFDADVDQLALLGDALAVQDIEFRIFKGRRNLILDHFRSRAAADDIGAAASYTVEAVREALAQQVEESYLKEVSTDRDQHYLFLAVWASQEADAMRALRDFGFGRGLSMKLCFTLSLRRSITVPPP